MIFIKINQCSVIRSDINDDFSFKELFGLDFDTDIKTEENAETHSHSIGPKNDIKRFGPRSSINWQNVKEFFSNIFKF